MPGCDGSITLTPAQLAMLIEGIDWRAPERVWKRHSLAEREAELGPVEPHPVHDHRKLADDRHPIARLTAARIDFNSRGFTVRHGRVAAPLRRSSGLAHYSAATPWLSFAPKAGAEEAYSQIAGRVRVF